MVLWIRCAVCTANQQVTATVMRFKSSPANEHLCWKLQASRIITCYKCLARACVHRGNLPPIECHATTSNCYCNSAGYVLVTVIVILQGMD